MTDPNNNELPRLTEQLSHELVAAPRLDLVAKYTAFNDALKPDLGVIYHPCGSDDISPSAAFPNSRVIYAETDRPAVQALEKAGVEVHEADAETFEPGPVDLVILLNPTIPSSGPVASLKEGGYVLANDYHGNASQLHDDERFELVGILHDHSPDNKPVLDTDNPGDHWKEVETDEEFRASYGYDAIAYMTKFATGTDSPSLEQYLDAAEKFKRDHPDAESMDGFLMSFSEEKLLLFPEGLPTIKGGADDFYVFQRVTNKENNPSVQKSNSMFS